MIVQKNQSMMQKQMNNMKPPICFHTRTEGQGIFRKVKTYMDDPKLAIETIPWETRKTIKNTDGTTHEDIQKGFMCPKDNKIFR